MSSETVDWLKKVSKASDAKVKLSFDIEEADEPEAVSKTSSKQFTNPKSNVIRKNYTSKDLTGLQVAHDLDSFQAGQSDILVLADRSVLEDEEEALVSMSLKEEARLKRLREVARHAKGYSGFKAYEEETEDSVVTLGGRSAKILQKYDFASSEFNDEPKLDEGFKIGTVPAVNPERKIEGKPDAFNEFDTVQSAGIETFIKKKRNGSEMEREKKRARKLAKTLFADEPEMIVESVSEDVTNEAVEHEEDDDTDMQRIIAATRREHLKTRVETDEKEEMEKEPKFVGGKSFDTLIMSESIFAPIGPVIEHQTAMEMDVISEDSINDREFHEDRSDLNSLEPFSAEPLVRNGVASTLALLKMRGINLQARGGQNDKSGKAAPSDIKLEYFDQFGNKLTSKEAYKELSRKFHGKGAGKDKLEKMKRRREETLKMESVVSTSQSAIVTNLRKQQEETGAPYMILSNTRQHSETPETTKHPSAAIEAKKPKIFGLQLKK